MAQWSGVLKLDHMQVEVVVQYLAEALIREAFALK